MVTDEVRRAANVDDLATRNTAVGLAVQWVTKDGNRSNVVSVNAVLQGVMHDHGALRVAGYNELGLRARFNSLLSERDHGRAAGLAQLVVAFNAGWVIDTLDGDFALTSECVELFGELWANDLSQCSSLGGPTGEDVGKIAAAGFISNVAASAAACV